MENNTNQQTSVPPVKKRDMRAFWTALLVTAIPITVLGIIGMTVGFASSLIISVVGLYIAAIIVAIVYGVRRKFQITAGIFTGLGISLLALVTTCFAVAFTAL